MLPSQEPSFYLRTRQKAHLDRILADHVGSKPEQFFRTIVEEAFSHHLIKFPLLTVPTPQPITPTDGLSHAYLAYAFHEIYKPCAIRQGFEGATISFETFLTHAVIRNSGPKANDIRYLIGEVGSGKSTLISHILVKYGRDLFAKHDLLPIRLGLEDETQSTPPSERKILKLLLEVILSGHLEVGLIDQATHDDMLGGTAFNHETDELAVCQLRVISAVTQLAARSEKRRLVLFIDNLDFIYHIYDRGQFIKEAVKKELSPAQITALQKRQRAHDIIKFIMGLFHQDGSLGRLGITAIIAARGDSVQHYIRRAFPQMPKPPEIDSFTYSITASPVDEVLQAHGVLIDKLIDLIPEKATREKFHETSLQLDLSTTSTNKHARDLLNADLRELSRQGLRQIVEHYRHFVWVPFIIDERMEVVARFQEQYTPSLLAFLTNGYKLFQQFFSEFPNIYLVRSDSLEEYLPVWAESLKAPHRHTYWLKRLLLEYIAFEERRKARVTPQAVYRIFSQAHGDNKCYEDHIVRLCLGSLAQCGSSHTIEFEFAPGELDYAAEQVEMIWLSRRGRRLMGGFDKDGEPLKPTKNPETGKESNPLEDAPPFCDTFTYLQLLVDDHLLPIPEKLSSLFVFDKLNYGYLVATEKYRELLGQMLRKKILQTLCFIDVLSLSLEHEKRIFSTVFTRLANYGIPVPKTKDIEARIMHDLRVILKFFPDIKLSEFEAARSTAYHNAAENLQRVYTTYR